MLQSEPVDVEYLQQTEVGVVVTGRGSGADMCHVSEYKVIRGNNVSAAVHEQQSPDKYNVRTIRNKEAENDSFIVENASYSCPHQLNTITTWRNSTMETFSQSVEFLESLILKSELILSSKLRDWPEARLQNVNFILHTGFNFNLLAADFFQSFQIF